MYYIYCNDLGRKGFRVIAIPEDDEGLQTAVLKAKLKRLGGEKEAIRFVYVVTVNNPTSTIMSNRRMRNWWRLSRGCLTKSAGKSRSFLIMRIAT